MGDTLLLKFRVKSTPYGVTRATLKALAAELDTTETMVIHLAISRFAKEVLPAYEPDGGPLSPPYFAWLKKTAKNRLPKGRMVSKASLVQEATPVWPAPEPGDIVWCRSPERPRDKPGPKPRPALVLEVTRRSDGIEVEVAYGTSQELGRLQAGEFAIRRLENAAAYLLAGLSYDTKFDLRKTLSLPWDRMFFAVPPDPRHGQIPKLGTLHSGMLKVAEAALRATRSTR